MNGELCCLDQPLAVGANIVFAPLKF